MLERNVRLYPWYAALFNSFFWLPVFFLYFSAHLPLEQVLILEAIYYAGVVVLEVPSGYFSDAVGRRRTLLLSSVAFVAAYALFMLGSTFGVFAAAQLFLAAGIAFNSGTDVSFHYDTLAALDRADEFPAREATVAHRGFLAGAIAALVGGAIAALSLRYAYGLSLLAALGMLGIVLAFREPPGHGRAEMRFGLGLPSQLVRCAAYLQISTLRWIFAFTILMIVINHVPYEFYQPYLRELGAGLPDAATPLSAGVHASLTMLLGAWVAARSIRVGDRIGIARTLLLAAAAQTAIIAVMGLVLHPLIVLLILFRATPRALMTAPINAAVAPRVKREHRATYLSMQSLAGRLAFSGVLFGLSRLAKAEGLEVAGWESISRMLLASAGLGIVGLGVLAVTARAVRDEPHQR